LIGFGRIICDGIVHALILDVIIQPEKQGEGIGKQIMDKLVAKCKKHKIRDIQLFSAKDKAGFYEKLGFECRKEDSPGMQLKKYW
jgi:N-acetylglutamate synthase-like GNAT family acetyltransferase